MMTVVAFEKPQDKEIRQMAEHYARLHRVMFDAHVAEGFTKAQAFELCTCADPDVVVMDGE
jgi:hypothetical protein